MEISLVERSHTRTDADTDRNTHTRTQTHTHTEELNGGVCLTPVEDKCWLEVRCGDQGVPSFRVVEQPVRLCRCVIQHHIRCVNARESGACELERECVVCVCVYVRGVRVCVYVCVYVCVCVWNSGKQQHKQNCIFRFLFLLACLQQKQNKRNSGVWVSERKRVKDSRA